VRKLIVTGDDFGLAVPVNEAIEEAHRRGILTTASLMVGAGAAADAVERARRLPTLKVGLHLVLVEGRSVLSSREIPDLVDSCGEFSTRLIGAGLNFFFRPGVRRQLETEIRAQFEAFAKTGLPLDHVNAHNHMHLHPTVLGLLLKVGRDYGLKAVRVPYEPFLVSWRTARQALLKRLVMWVCLLPWMALVKVRLRRANIRSNDRVFGLYDSGHLHGELIVRLLQQLPPGVTEIYCHPATRRCAELDRAMPDYQHEQEFKALISPAVREAIVACGFQRVAFSEL